MIYKASGKDIDIFTALALLLWPDNDPDELRAENKEILEDDDAAVFIAEIAGKHVGFAHCQLRHDYVEGTSSSPVGYLEGIFVDEKFRGGGIARQLLAACERWAKESGCCEFASDCELDNTASLAFHMKLGFEETGRVICFAKKLV